MPVAPKLFTGASIRSKKCHLQLGRFIILTYSRLLSFYSCLFFRACPTVVNEAAT